jgi:hypothetical protein
MAVDREISLCALMTVMPSSGAAYDASKRSELDLAF